MAVAAVVAVAAAAAVAVAIGWNANPPDLLLLWLLWPWLGWFCAP